MDLTPGPEVPFTREQLQAGVQALIDNAYIGGPVTLDAEDLDEMVSLVLTVVAPKIREAAYRAGREDAARDITKECEAMEAKARAREDELLGGTLDIQATWRGAARLARKTCISGR